MAAPSSSAARPCWPVGGSRSTSRSARALERAQDGGGTAVAVAWDGAVRGLLVVADTVRPTSAEAVRLLRGQGLRPVLLTGDNAAAARAVAAEVGVDEVVADVLPSEKAAVVRRLQREGRVVAVVGDGVNDAPALAQADLGIAVGTGTDVAIEASDLTLVSGDLRGAADAIALSRRTLRTIKGNLFWAFAYNVAALPLAAVGYLDPLIAGAAMALSSLFVIGNSLRLRRFPEPMPGLIKLVSERRSKSEAAMSAPRPLGAERSQQLAWPSSSTSASTQSSSALCGSSTLACRPNRASLARERRRSLTTAQSRRTPQSGGMFWFSRKKFVGS